MKKVLIGLFCLLFAVYANAGNILDVEGNQHDRIWKEMRDNWHNIAVGGTLTNGLTISVGNLTMTTGNITATAGSINATAGVLTSYGYTADVSSNKSTFVYMTQSGTFTPASGGAATTLTNTFVTSYIESPAVFMTQHNITQTNLTITVSSNKFTVTGGDGWQTNASWMARGRVK